MSAITSRFLAVWQRNWSVYLRVWKVDFLPPLLEAFADPFDRLSRIKPPDARRSFGPTAASKTMFALCPAVFVPWDALIREKLVGGGTDDSRMVTGIRSRALWQGGRTKDTLWRHDALQPLMTRKRGFCAEEYRARSPISSRNGRYLACATSARKVENKWG